MPGRAPRARRTQGRGKKQSERSSVIPADPPSANADVILVDLSSCNADSLTVPQFPRRGRGTRNQLRVSRVLERPSNANVLLPPQRSRRGRTRNREETNRSRPVSIFPDELPPIAGGRRRSQGDRSQSRPSRTPRNHPPPNRNSSSAPRSSQRRSRRNMQPRARPLVISLDVTYSSDELENEIPSSPEKEPDTLLNFSLTPR
ncbi:uncharacterized protein LOC135223855 isoform X2 [Macrobrachium nipponense]|uniref:uncharacterized protein LOC135223855 isoform X2 n=1 Tax=Macrobrachium nipponense TaxID=159736 RepID=UPI0030C7F251